MKGRFPLCKVAAHDLRTRAFTAPSPLRYSPALMLRSLPALAFVLGTAMLPSVAVAADDPVDAAAARQFLERVRPSPDLQHFLDGAVAAIGAADPKFLASSPRIAVLDLAGREPSIAAGRGDQKVYPASVVKFVYLMAAYAWQERGLLAIDAAFNRELSAMIRESSNQDTRKVFARLTGTEPGPELPEVEYAAFRERRLAVKRWLVGLGIEDLHAVNPTYDGNGDLFGRDAQFLRDRSVAGGLPAASGEFVNRQAMTASGTVRLLALLATDRALTPGDSAVVRRRMLRDVRTQPHLVHRIAGGVAGLPGIEVYAKSGTWGPIYADAGIVRDSVGRQFALAVFTDAAPPYRGDAIARLARRLAEYLFATPSSLRQGESR
jgi:beta-lactamase class A